MWLDDLKKDLENYDIPFDLEAYNKIKTELTSGKRIWWYYNEDLEYAKELELNPREDIDIHSGIVVGIHATEYNGGELDISHVIVVVESYSCEKEYPVIWWMTMNRLLNDEELVEIFSKEE